MTTKSNLRKVKENKVTYVGRIEKNWKVEVRGRKFKIEELFKDASKVVNIPEVGRVKIIKCLMEDKKDPYYLVCTNWKKKPENIIKEYLKRFWIDEKHRRDKSVLLMAYWLTP